MKTREMAVSVLVRLIAFLSLSFPALHAHGECLGHPNAILPLASLQALSDAKALARPACQIAYRYVRELKANYYDVYNGSGEPLELKKEKDYGCVSPLCALEKAVKLQSEGQCKIIRKRCKATWSDRYIQIGAFTVEWGGNLMVSLEGVTAESEEAQELLRRLRKAGMCE